MRSSDEAVLLEHSYQRLQKIRQKHPECYEKMKAKQKTQVRISESLLSSGNTLVLMTNLPNKIRGEELSDLYCQRWEIEKKYYTLKNKMKFESATGKATVYVYQDFWVQILVYSIIQDIRKSADEKIASRSQKETIYPMHTNENMAIGLFKEAMIKLLLETKPQKLIEKLERLQNEMENYILPIRNLPCRERKKNLSHKYSST